MKLQYGLLAAMLLTAGSAIAADDASSSMPAAETTSPGSASETMQSESDQKAVSTETQSAEPAQTEATATEEKSGFSTGSVVRSAFTTAVEDREPVDKINELTTDTKQVYYFTELRDMAGQTAKHVWKHNGEVMATIEFNVKGPRWRVWSSKSMIPQWTGEWTVQVLNGADQVIAEDSFQYTAAMTPATDTAPAEETSPATETAPATPSAPMEQQ
jgi:hypothetical protein